ncbi:Putative DNA ligase-like protein [Aquisphaera giovannonii]|uniref:DNA ligase (ATP) n=1 Tax=Aquisphaera giovannonii TaxID=406548 RepID=A0A5B9W341_9BACT|nr:ATP-dependent DNA ligase [Aquisphaera giovannonii]QEH34475.1 Putative DNA ligase-like protein [Aquisphaera giovannonii]
MKAFADLYSALDETTKTSEKVRALVDYFGKVSPADAAWAVYFLIGRKPRQVVPSPKLRAWAMEESGVPEWLFQESYDAVGDIAETIALLLPPPTESSDLALTHWVEDRLLPLRAMAEEAQHAAIVAAWRSLDQPQRFVWNKLISGAFRVGVSQQLVTRAIGAFGKVDPAVVAHRLMGDWEPSPAFFERLIAEDAGDADLSRPYPFFLAYALEDPLESLGEVSDWQAEWKWDGIRSQLIRRGGQTFLWSRGEELVTERYPELAAVGDCLPEGTAIDGEILPFKDGHVLPFAMLQKRIGRKSVTKSILSEVPVILMAYDLVEDGGADIRGEPLSGRRSRLAMVVAGVERDQPVLAHRIRLSPTVPAASWPELAMAQATSREQEAEGLMIKRRGSAYGVGRRRGDWWKWKVQPHTIDAVLILAARGTGKRASLYTDYTFGVWDPATGNLVPIAKAYSGLTDEEIRKVDAFVRRNMIEKFGPVRTVKPELVFELAFEGLNRSTRHKSGIAVRFPRILRWRTDKTAAEADTLDTVKALLPPVATA